RTDVTTRMNPLAPAWLTEPDDANDLAPGVWPDTSRRTKKGELSVAGLQASRTAETYGTPSVALPEQPVSDRAERTRRRFDDATAGHGGSARVYYAGKAFLTSEVARWMLQAGLNVDVCSRGELETALAAGVPAEKIGFHGNNKRVSELERAIAVGLGSIVVD